MKRTGFTMMLVVLTLGALQALSQEVPQPQPEGGLAPGGREMPRRRGNQRGNWQPQPGQQPMQPGNGPQGFGPGNGDGPQGFGPGNGGGPNFLDRLRQENPEEFERLSKLYREDRQAFMKEARTMMQARGGNMMRGQGGPGPRISPEEQKCQELSRLYHESANDDDKAAIRQELEAAVEQAFEVRLQSSRDRIANLEAQLAKFREHITSLEENRKPICKARLDELTRPPELNWEGNW